MPQTSIDILVYKIALTMLPGVGTINARKLLSHVGGVEALFKEKKANILKIPGVGPLIASSFADLKTYFKRAEEEIEFIANNNIKTYFLLDDNYPLRLKQCIDSPVLFYTQGDFDLDSKHIISIVGTRRSTDYGREMCHALISGLVDLDVIIVSGLAYGIDTSAHRNALEFNIKTVGVLAHGLDRIYPPVNYTLAQKMLQHGGLVTEFMSNTNPDREHFPMRNRIIAGLSDATIVIEAGPKGGALITADIANSYNRDVFAVPGRVSDNYSEGCNNLIKTNRAALVQKPEDILYIMGWDEKLKKKPAIQQQLFLQLEPNQEIIYNILQQFEECSLDKICLESQLSTSKVAAGLLNLEFEGLVRSLPGKMYKIS